MRTLIIADGTGTVQIRGRRAVVRIGGSYVGQAVRRTRGGWAVPGSAAAYPGPADAAEALAYERAA